MGSGITRSQDDLQAASWPQCKFHLRIRSDMWRGLSLVSDGWELFEKQQCLIGNMLIWIKDKEAGLGPRDIRQLAQPWGKPCRYNYVNLDRPHQLP